jgi:hypothetical protein
MTDLRLIRDIFVFLGAVIFLGVLVHWFVVIVLLFAYIVAHFLLRDAWFADDGVTAILFNPDQPGVVGRVRIGTNVWQTLPKNCVPSPLSDHLGRPLYVIERWDDKGLKFSWIHEASKIDLLQKMESFDLLAEIAAETQLGFMRLKSMFRPLILKVSGKIQQVVLSDQWKEVLTLDPMSLIENELREIELIVNPYEAIIERQRRSKAHKVTEEEGADDGYPSEE